MRTRLLAVMATILALFSLGAPATAQDGYSIKSGDVLEIEVLEDASLNRQVLVLPDGSFSFPLVGTMQAGGMTVEQVRAALVGGLQQHRRIVRLSDVIPDQDVAVRRRQLATIRRDGFIQIVRVPLHIEVVHVLPHVIHVDPERRRELVPDAKRHLLGVGRLHVVVHQDRRDRGRGTGDHALTQHGGVTRAGIGERVGAPRGIATLLEAHEARDAVVDNAETTAHEGAIVLERIPRERRARREIAELILAIAGIQEILERRNRLKHRVIRPWYRVLVVHRVELHVVAQSQRQREVRLNAPLVIDVNAGGVPSGVGNGIRGAIGVGKAYRDRRGHGQRIRII